MLLAGLAACQQVAVALPAAADDAIAAAVNERLASDAELRALHIEVQVAAGRVRLRGAAPDTARRARITALARGVDGVVEVVNQVSVQVRSP